jgi:A/G-specific adenine glycosylase
MEDVEEIAVIIRRCDGAVLLRKCGHGERWAGLWDFPRFAMNARICRVAGVDQRESPANSGKAGGSAASTPATLMKEIAAEVHRLTGLAVTNIQHFTKLRHGVTRFRVTLTCFTAAPAANPPRFNQQSELRWASHEELDRYPLSTTGRKLAHAIAESILAAS